MNPREEKYKLIQIVISGIGMLISGFALGYLAWQSHLIREQVQLNHQSMFLDSEYKEFEAKSKLFDLTLIKLKNNNSTLKHDTKNIIWELEVENTGVNDIYIPNVWLVDMVRCSKREFFFPNEKKWLLESDYNEYASKHRAKNNTSSFIERADGTLKLDLHEVKYSWSILPQEKRKISIETPLPKESYEHFTENEGIALELVIFAFNKIQYSFEKEITKLNLDSSPKISLTSISHLNNKRISFPAIYKTLTSITAFRLNGDTFIQASDLSKCKSWLDEKTDK